MARERHNACSNSGQWKGGDEKKTTTKKHNVLHVGFRAVEVQASYKITINTGFHTGFFSRGGTFVCGKVDQLRP